MKKVGFIIPGFYQSPNDEAFKQIAKYFTERGIEPIPVEIKWKRTTISQNIDQFLQIYHQTDAEKKYVLGFSFGAIIAFIAATKVSFNTVILCSLSPYFTEDFNRIKKSWAKSVGIKRFKDFQQYSATKLAQEVSTFTILLSGGGEPSAVKFRRDETYDALLGPKKSIGMAGSVKHDIGNKTYQNEIKKIIMHLK